MHNSHNFRFSIRKLWERTQHFINENLSLRIYKKPCHWSLFSFHPDISNGYGDIRFQSFKVMIKDNLEITNRPSDLYSFLEMRIITFFQESCLGIDKRDEARAKATRKRLKISFLFTRGYLGNRMSYRDKWKNILKGKIPRFQRSFIRWPEIIIFGVIVI